MNVGSLINTVIVGISILQSGHELREENTCVVPWMSVPFHETLVLGGVLRVESACSDNIVSGARWVANANSNLVAMQTYIRVSPSKVYPSPFGHSRRTPRSFCT